MIADFTLYSCLSLSLPDLGAFHAEPGRRFTAMEDNDLDVILDRRDKKSDRRAKQKPFEGEDRRRGDRRQSAGEDTTATKTAK
jgi:hypothetical protein